MDRFGTIIVIAGLIVASHLAAAEVHHRDYDEAELDLIAVAYHLRNAFDALNDTINNVILLDNGSARSDSIYLSSLIEGARKTLLEVPEDVDSYEILQEAIYSLGRTEDDLEILIEGLDNSLSALEDIRGYSFEKWTTPSIIENLTTAHRGLVGLPEGLDLMETGRSNLLADMDGFSSFDIEGSWDDIAELGIGAGGIIEGLNEISDVMDNIEENSTSVDSIITDLMSGPLSDLDEDLVSVLMESDPDMESLLDADIILSSASAIDGPLGYLLEMTGGVLENISLKTLDLRSSQSTFLTNIRLLESDDNSTLSETLNLLDICLDNMEMMNDDLVNIEGSFAGHIQEYDNGSVRTTLDLIRDMLSGYEDRLEDLRIRGPDMQKIADDISSIMEGNIFSSDTDLDGNLTEDEILRIPEDPLPMDNILELIDNLDLSISDLLGIPAGYYKEIEGTLPLLKTAYESAERFTMDHVSLISGMKLIVNTSRAPPMNTALSESLRYFMRMESYLEEILELDGDLREKDIDVRGEWVDNITGMMELYERFLLSRKETVDEPVLILTLDRDIVPYDSVLRYSVIAIDIDPVNGSYLPLERMINLTLDGMEMGGISLHDGSGSGILSIERSMGIGYHVINASMMSQNGNETASSAGFMIRRIRTNILLEHGETDIMIGEGVDVYFDVKDEFMRRVNTNVSVQPMGSVHAVPSNVTILDLSLGVNNIVFESPQDDFFLASSSDLEIAVFQEPLIEIGSNGTMFIEDEKITISVDLFKGNGSVDLTMNGETASTFEMVEGDRNTWSVNSTALGNGTFVFRAIFLPDDEITVEGASNRLVIEIDLTQPDDPGELPDDDDDEGPPDVNDTPFYEPEQDERWLDPLYQWMAFGVISMIFIPLAVFIIIKKRGVKKRQVEEEAEEGFHLPNVYFRKVRKERETDVEPERKIEKPAARIKDPTREELIGYYLDVIRRSPRELGINGSMTPREVSSALVRNGCPQNIAEKISRDFEWSIYKLGTPNRETVRTYRKSQGSVRDWFSSLIGRTETEERGGETG